MATWTSATFAFESQLTSTKLNQLQDNFTALAQGASGAPKVLTAALSQTGGSEAVVAGTIRSYNVTLPKLSDYSPGSTVEALSEGFMNINQNAYTKFVEWGMPRPGTITVVVSLYSGISNAYAKVYKNGSAIGAELVAATGYANQVANYTVVAGDLIQLYGYNANSAAWGISIQVSSATAIRNL